MIKRFVRGHLFLILILLGLVLRLSLMFLTYSLDEISFINWGRDALKSGFSGLYDKPAYPAYPPLSIYLFSIIDQLRNMIFDFFWNMNLKFPIFPSKIIPLLESLYFLTGLIKIPAILADIGLSYLAYLFTKKIFKQRAGMKPIAAACLVLFNPAFFYTSAVWGQIDALALFFTGLSLYFLLYFRKNLALSSFFFASALLIKQSTVIFIPVFILILIKTHGVKKLLYFLLIVALTFFIVFLPFYQKGNIWLFPLKIYFEKIMTSSGMPYISNHSFNYWALISQWKTIEDKMNIFGNFSYRFVGNLIAFGIFLSIAFKFLKDKFSPKQTIYFFLLSSLTFFLFLTRIHERHFQPTLFFLLLLIFYFRNFYSLFFLASIYHFINLYHNMLYPYSRLIDIFVHSKFVENLCILFVLLLFVTLFIQFFKRKNL